MKHMLVFFFVFGVFCSVSFAVDEPFSTWSFAEGHPSISGKNVVYHYYYSTRGYYNVYLRDAETGNYQSIASTADNQKNPDIDGDIIVWQDDRNGNWDIYAMELSTRTVFPVCTAKGDQENPRVDGDIIVWQDLRNGNWDIYSYNIATGQEQAVYTGTFAQITPDVSTVNGKAYVVWQHHNGSIYNVYHKTIGPGRATPLSSSTAGQYRPRIDYPRVVWYDYRNGNADIYMYTFGYLLPVSIVENNTASQIYPVVSGRKIVWIDNRNGNWDIYCGDLDAAAIYPVCVEDSTQYAPDIDGSLVVWEDSRNTTVSDDDLYAGALDADSWHACTTLLDFEFVQDWKYPEWTGPVDNMFAGVTFSASHDGCEQDYVILDRYPDGMTSSGNVALGNYNGFTPCEFVSAELTMTFDQLQSRVSFYVGSHCGDYDIYAYNAETGGDLVDSVHFSLDCDLSEHGVHRFVELTSEIDNIKRVVINSWGLHVRIDDLEFNYDDTPPTAVLLEPSFDECTCGVYPILGTACDIDRSWVDYTLSYCPVNSDTWTEIISARGQICGTGDLLTHWDTSAIDHGRYFLKLEVSNECGLTSTDMTVAFVDKLYNTVDIQYPHEYNGSGNGIVGNIVCIDGTVWDHLCYDSTNGYNIDYREKGGSVWYPVMPGPHGTADVLNNPIGNWDTIANGIPDGPYEIRVSATDLCDNYKEDTVLIYIDNTIPEVEIVSPTNCQFYSVGEIIDIVGLADDENLSSWNLSYVGGAANSWTTLASGTSGVHGDIFSWDTSGLIPCSYTLRLRCWDQSLVNCTNDRHINETTVTVKLGADLNGDGCVDLTDFSLLAAEWLTGCSF